MSEAFKVVLVDEVLNTYPVKVVKVLSEDGEFLGFEPTDAQVDQVAGDHGMTQRETNILHMDTDRFHIMLAHTAFQELRSGVGDSAFRRGTIGFRVPASESDILMEMAQRVKNTTDRLDVQGGTDE